ncbi:hypothetical protein GJ496_011292 [Pomphorhynchus laevis]|nr:hypothetical protein GJ496_011292 [Pomphorhynchus laevis]
MASSTSDAIGIDLGTTFTCVGNRTTPSYITFDENDRAVGEAARNRAESKVGYTVYDFKRMIGREFNDPMLQKDLKNWHFKVKLIYFQIL